MEYSINSKNESDVIDGIKLVISGKEIIDVTYNTQENKNIKKVKSSTDNTVKETISRSDFSLYHPDESLNPGYLFSNWHATSVKYSTNVKLSLMPVWNLIKYKSYKFSQDLL